MISLLLTLDAGVKYRILGSTVYIVRTYCVVGQAVARTILLMIMTFLTPTAHPVIRFQTCISSSSLASSCIPQYYPGQSHLKHLPRCHRSKYSSIDALVARHPHCVAHYYIVSMRRTQGSRKSTTLVY
jgi:hypothetical protein